MKKSYKDKENEIKSLKNGKGLKYLLDEIYSITGHPMIIIDTSYKLICYNDIVTDDWLWNELITCGGFSHKTVNFFKKEKFIENFANSEIVTLMVSDSLKYERINGKLFDKDNVQLGNICAVACFKPFEEGEMDLVELACECLSTELQNSDIYIEIERVFHDSLFNRIISGNINKKIVNRKTLGFLYNELKNNIYVAVVDISKYDNTNTHLAYFRDYFKSIQNEYKYFTHINNVIIIISTNDEVFSIKNDLQELNDFFIQNNIYAGVSSRFQDIIEINKYYKEAIISLNYGMESKRNQNIFLYDDFKIGHYLLTAKNNNSIITYPNIVFMQKYDTENNSNYLLLLYTLLSYGMDINLTAEKLGLSLEELCKKIEDFENIFKLDLKNGDALFSILIYIKYLTNNEKPLDIGQKKSYNVER